MKKQKTIKANAFRPIAEKDEVSVMRLDFCSPSFCKQYGKKIQSPENEKTYFGFGLLTAERIRKVDANVVYTHKKDNFYHADIKIGYTPVKGKELPAEYQLKVNELAKSSKLYIDPEPDSYEWQGEDLVY